VCPHDLPLPVSPWLPRSRSPDRVMRCTSQGSRMGMAYSPSVTLSRVWGDGGVVQSQQRDETKATEATGPFGRVGRFGRRDSGWRVIAGHTGGPVTELTEPTDPGANRRFCRFCRAVRSVHAPCPRPPAGGPRRGPGATTDSSTRSPLHERNVPCWSVEAEACDVVCAGPHRAANWHGLHPRKADVS